MKRIKVIHIVRSLATGGMETGVRNLVSRLDPELFEQKVCTLTDSGADTVAGSICLGRAGAGLELLVPHLARTFLREKPDIVHSRNWATIEAIVAARLCVTPAVVHSEHGRDLQTLGRQPLRRRVLRRVAYGLANKVFCVSHELRQYYCRELHLRDCSFDVIPNGVDVEAFRPDPNARADVRAKLGVGANTLVVGTVGRLDPVKDHFTLMHAAEMAVRQGVDLRLVIIGDGPQREALEGCLARKPDFYRRALFTGNVGNVAHWVNGFDVFVLPSLSEGMSNTLLEAMAVGVAPIATAVGGNNEVIEHGCSGMLVQPRDPEGICRHLLQLCAAPEKRQEFSRNARLRITNHFSLDRMMNRYSEMYFQLINPNKRAVALTTSAETGRRRLRTL